MNSSQHVIVNIKILAVKGWRNVARHLAAIKLAGVGSENGPLDLAAALRVDGMGDVGVQLQPVLAIAISMRKETIFVEPLATVIAEPGAQMVFFRASRAMIAQLSGWHGQEEPIVAVDQLHVANDERAVKGE